MSFRESFTLHIELGNEAMEEGEHVAGALRATAEKLEGGAISGVIRDENGNTVGGFLVGREVPEPFGRHPGGGPIVADDLA